MTRFRIDRHAAGYKTEHEESVCGRCGGSAIDPQDSAPGTYNRPPALEPCRSCVKPEQEPKQN